MAILYALKSKEGTYVKDTRCGSLQIFDEIQEAKKSSVMRLTDSVVEVVCSQRIDGFAFTQQQAQEMYDFINEISTTDDLDHMAPFNQYACDLLSKMESNDE